MEKKSLLLSSLEEMRDGVANMQKLDEELGTRNLVFLQNVLDVCRQSGDEKKVEAVKTLADREGLEVVKPLFKAVGLGAITGLIKDSKKQERQQEIEQAMINDVKYDSDGLPRCYYVDLDYFKILEIEKKRGSYSSDLMDTGASESSQVSPEPIGQVSPVSEGDSDASKRYYI